MKFQKNNEVKARGNGKFIAFIKRHKVPLGIITGSIIAVVVVIFIAASAALKTRTAKIKDGLEGRLFITNTDEDSVYGIQLFAFKDGMIAEENWKKGKLTGNISSYDREYHGNSIYFFSAKSTESRILGSREALNIMLFLLVRPDLALLRSERAVFLKTFIFSGDLSFLALAASSRKITSRHQ